MDTFLEGLKWVLGTIVFMAGLLVAAAIIGMGVGFIGRKD